MGYKAYFCFSDSGTGLTAAAFFRYNTVRGKMSKRFSDARYEVRAVSALAIQKNYV